MKPDPHTHYYHYHYQTCYHVITILTTTNTINWKTMFVYVMLAIKDLDRKNIWFDVPEYIILAKHTGLYLLFSSTPANNISCCQRPEHELNEAKIRVLNSC